MASRELKVEIIGDSRSLERAFGRANKSSGSFAGGLGNLAKAGIAAGAALGVGLVVGMKKSIDAASNLQEQINKTNVVFAKSADEVLDWSKGLEQSFGLSQRAALEAAGTFGNMLVPMGFARQEAAAMSEQMVQLAGDMASFNNASPEETLLAIRSGLAGETEPLRKFGVFLSAARVQEEALAETHKKNAKELTQAEKATAAYNIMLKDTADTQGDFARSAGSSLANQIRIAKASFEDLAAAIGSALLPVAIKLMGFVNNRLIPGLGDAAGVVRDFWDGLQKRLSKAPDFKSKLRITITGVAELAGKFVNEVISKIESMLPQKPVIFNPRLEARGIGTGGGVDWAKVAEDIFAALAVALEESKTIAQALGNTITDAIDSVDWNKVGVKFGQALPAAILSGVATVLDPAFWFKNWQLMLAVAFNALALLFPEVFGVAKLGSLFSGPFLRALAQFSPKLAAAFGRLIADIGPIASAALKRVGDDLFRLATVIFGRLTKAAVFVVKVLGLTAVIAAISDFVRAAIAKFKELLDWLSRLPGRITSAIGDLGDLLYNAGAALIQGLWDGAKSKVGGFLSFLGGVASKVKSVVTLGLRGSPEYFTYYVGGELMTDMGKGVTEKQQKMIDAIKDAIEAAKQAVLDAKGDFASAFDALASAALAAFDRVTSDFVTKTERKISRQDEQRAAAERKQALDDANKALDEANAARARLTQGEDETPEDFARRIQEANQAVIDAIKARDEALFQIRRAADERLAAQERQQHEASRERRRVAFERQLGDLEDQLARGEISAKQFRTRVLALFEKYDVPFNAAGKVLGAALSAGLHEALGDATKAARNLIEAIAREMTKFKLIAHVEVQPESNRGNPPHRQFGGPVHRARPYIVGEKGPELFIPSSSGRISPSLSMSGGGGVAEITVPVYLDSAKITEVVRREMLRFQKRNGTSAV